MRFSAVQRPAANGQIKIVTGSESFGNSYISVLVKRCFKICDGTAIRSSVDDDFRLLDIYYDDGEPLTSTLQFESELSPAKRLVDLVVIGRAYAPTSSPTHHVDVSVSVSDQFKQLRVVGDRTAHYVPGRDPVFSDPQQFVAMQMRYENSYGGTDTISDEKIPFWYPRNDKGKGVAISNKAESIEGLQLPNIEDPADLLTPERLVIGDANRWHLQPLPAGIGWREKNWFPRCSLVGSCPPFLDVGTVTNEERMGLLPKDYVALAKQFKLAPDLEGFGNGASLGMSLDQISGSERVSLTGLTPDGRLDFSLPKDMPSISLDLGYGLEPLITKTFSVTIRPDELVLEMIWAGTKMIGEFSKWSLIKNLIAEVN